MSTNIWVVNDESSLTDCLREQLSDCSVRAFESLSDAATAMGRCEGIIVDLSAVAPINLGPRGMYSGIAALIRSRPHCPVVILSGVSTGFAEDVMLRVRDVEPDACVSYVELHGADNTWAALRSQLHLPPR